MFDTHSHYGFKRFGKTISVLDEILIKHVYYLGKSQPHLTAGSVSYSVAMLNAGNNCNLKNLIQSVYFDAYCFLMEWENRLDLHSEPVDLPFDDVRIVFIPSNPTEYFLLGAIVHYRGAYLFFSPVEFKHLEKNEIKN